MIQNKEAATPLGAKEHIYPLEVATGCLVLPFVALYWFVLNKLGIRDKSKLTAGTKVTSSTT